ncbi:DMT family transporter [Rhodobacteraceae bacterium D3-12]|nr:DMT family transporter [Rhodobacteraceae bacterium D3-12]
MTAVWKGEAGLILLYTGLISLADAITKDLSGRYAAPQMYVIAGIVVVALCLGGARLGKTRQTLHTNCPRAMALRSLFTVLATLCFFLAFRYLPFAQVFLFIGMMPLFAALLAGPVLGDTVSPASWGALAAGFLGVVCLFPQGFDDIGVGHLAAFAAAFLGTVSIVLARFIGRFDAQGIAQVFYPNLALLVVMAVVLPYVWKPMSLGDAAWAVGYGVLLFVARSLLVVALRSLAAHAVTSLMKLQFVWMVVIGASVFGEWPTLNTYVGVTIVVFSGLFLVYDDQVRRGDAPVRA